MAAESEFELPPAPDLRNVPQGQLAACVVNYGHACATAARAPLIEANASLSAANAALVADKSALLDELRSCRERVEELEQYEEMVILRCGELETFEEYRAAMQRDESAPRAEGE